MKKITFLLLLLNVSLCISQTGKENRENLEKEKALIIEAGGINYDINGMTEYAIIEAPKLNTAEVYEKSINWIKENYRNPSDVIKSEIENEKIRFVGNSDVKYSYGGLNNLITQNYSYMIELSFKDGKCKFEPMELSFLNSNYDRVFIDLKDGSQYFNKKGNVRGFSKYDVSTYGYVFSLLSKSLGEYLNDTGKKDNDW